MVETIWCLDGWYADRRDAEGMRGFYLEHGATEAHVVPHSEWSSFGVVYAACEPFTDWHAHPAAFANQG